MQAKEAGLGYRVEYEDTLYLVPDRICRLNAKNQYHSDKQASIYWKGGAHFYFLNGVKFEKELWEKVVSGKMPYEDILKIEDVDQRSQALKYGDWDMFVSWYGAKKIDEFVKYDVHGNDVPHTLWEFPEQKEGDERRIFNKTVHFARY